jgi:membrane-bound lytic murein transglycosylase D
MRATFPPAPPQRGNTPLWLTVLMVVLVLAGCQMPQQKPPDIRKDSDTHTHTSANPDQPTDAAAERPVRVPRIPMHDLPDALAADLWEDIRQSFQLDHGLDQSRVQQELRWLQSHPSYFTNLQERMQRYLPHIHAEIVARQLPGELALLPIIESALDPYALSRSGAAGLWQFIPTTATRFGLERNWWVDARRDPVQSTSAALDYLVYLNGHMRDWHLALASYNAGEGTILRAIANANGERSYWRLRLPRETSVYVPRLLAIAAAIADPDKHGIVLPDLTAETPFVTVDTHGPFDLTKAAAALGVDVGALYEWNPALNQWATPPQGPHHLHVPADLADTAQVSISAVPEDERVQWLRVRVAEGETLSHLARRHKTDVATLRSINRLNGSHIRAGQALLVPRSQPARGALAGPGRGSSHSYKVKPGDSLWAISRAHGLSVTALARANDLEPDQVLKVGQRLNIPATTAGTSANGSRRPEANREVIRKVRYGVRRGDSLARIATRFNVAVNDLVEWNKLDAKRYLQPGQNLLIYVNVTAAE